VRVANYIRTIVVAIILSTIFLISCKDDPDSAGDCAPENRTGTVCKDGTTSNATGSGACSGHGGVDYWICK